MLRIGLFLIGFSSLAWLPVSFRFRVTLEALEPVTFLVQSQSGCVEAHLYERDARPGIDGWALRLERNWDPRVQAWWPFAGKMDTTYDIYIWRGGFVVVPLWLVAFLCLAWPVTSFILARRRRKGRGFEVEARAGAAVPPPES